MKCVAIVHAVQGLWRRFGRRAIRRDNVIFR